MNYEKIMLKARRTNARRDKLEKKSGFATPNEGVLSTQIETAMSAIKAGIKVNDWNCVAEGQAMLELLAERARALEIEIAGKPSSGGIYTTRTMKPEEVFEKMVKVYLDDCYLGTIKPK